MLGFELLPGDMRGVRTCISQTVSTSSHPFAPSVITRRLITIFSFGMRSFGFSALILGVFSLLVRQKCFYHARPRSLCVVAKNVLCTVPKGTSAISTQLRSSPFDKMMHSYAHSGVRSSAFASPRFLEIPVHRLAASRRRQQAPAAPGVDHTCIRERTGSESGHAKKGNPWKCTRLLSDRELDQLPVES